MPDVQGKNFDPEYLKKNPNGTVPTLVVDGETFTDSVVCLSQYSAYRSPTHLDEHPRPSFPKIPSFKTVQRSPLMPDRRV